MIWVGDIGTVFEVTVTDQAAAVVDISGASTKTMNFVKPNGVVVSKTAVLVNTGTDGKMQYTVIAGDLDLAGQWAAQGRVVIGAGAWRTTPLDFTVSAVVA
jgi:hypothetical protein